MPKKNSEIQNEINERIRKASQFYYLIKSILWNKDTGRKCKTTIYKVYFKEILLHGVEKWTCTKRQESKIQATSDEILDSNTGKDQDRQNQKCTQHRRAQDKDIQNQIKGKRLRWFRHVKRMDKHRLSKRLLEIKMTAKRPRGRP
jgi:hypothetical protein